MFPEHPHTDSIKGSQFRWLWDKGKFPFLVRQSQLYLGSQDSSRPSVTQPGCCSSQVQPTVLCIPGGCPPPPPPPRGANVASHRNQHKQRAVPLLAPRKHGQHREHRRVAPLWRIKVQVHLAKNTRTLNLLLQSQPHSEAPGIITTYSKSFHVPAQIPIPLPRPEVFLSASSDLLASPAQHLIAKKDTCMHASTHAEQAEFTEKTVRNGF